MIIFMVFFDENVELLFLDLTFSSLTIAGRIIGRREDFEVEYQN